jgi:hypothetical protein
MLAYQVPKPRTWTPARAPHVSLGQTTPNFKPKPLDLDNGSVYAFAVTQGLALAYAATASFLYGKSHPAVDRVLLGIGALAFGAAGVFSYNMLVKTGTFTWHPANGVVGAVMGTMNSLIAIGAAGAVFKRKLPASSAQKAVAESLPI